MREHGSKKKYGEREEVLRHTLILVRYSNSDAKTPPFDCVSGWGIQLHN
jgi:hypothetical protein